MQQRLNGVIMGAYEIVNQYKGDIMIRKRLNSIGMNLLLYILITFLFMEHSYHLPAAISQDDGAVCLLAYGLGGLCLYAFVRITGQRPESAEPGLFKDRQSMRPFIFLGIICIAICVQYISAGIDYVLESGLNAIGYSAKDSMEEASSDSDTIMMFIYSGLGAPIIEELIYRGYVLRNLLSYGKIPAIIVSSLLFGVMHENIPQAIFAFLLGLVLGYVATEYSVKWAIILHMFNNMIYGDLFYRFAQLFSKDAQSIIYTITDGVLIIGAVLTLILARKRLAAFFRGAHGEKGFAKEVLLSVYIMLFIATELFVGVMAFTKI